MAGPAPGHGNGYPPSGNVPLFPAKAAGLPAAFFDAVRTGEGGRGPFWKKVSLPPSRSPHPPKNFYAGLWQALMPHRPFCFPRSLGGMPKNMDGRARHPHDGKRPQDARHPALPSPSGLSCNCPAGCRKTDTLFKRRTIIYKIRLLSCLFAKRGTIAGPPDNGGDRPYRPEQKFYGGMGVRGKGDAFPKASLFPRPCLSRGPIPCPCS